MRRRDPTRIAGRLLFGQRHRFHAPWPGDREIVEPYGALYSIYDMYTDLFAEGPRKAKGWTPEWVRYEKPGQMKRGYWNSTRCRLYPAVFALAMLLATPSS